MSERENTTLYIERSKVREIVIGHNAATQAVLSKIDALPIFTVGDFLITAQLAPRPSAWRACWVSLNTSRTQLFEIEAEATVKARETGGCVIPLYVAPSLRHLTADWIDQNYQVDRYGVALMMIREGCSDPAGLARRILSEFDGSAVTSTECGDM